MLSLKKFKVSYGLRLFLLVLFVHMLIVGVLNFHRIQYFPTHYPLPDADYEGTIWSFWFHSFAQENGINLLLNRWLAFPVGFDYTYLPSQNLFVDFMAAVLTLFGSDWQNLIFITNAAALSSYVLSGLASFLLAFQLTKCWKSSLVASFIFTYSFDHIMMGRGIMLFGQLWLIPLFYWSYFAAYTSKKVYIIIFSALIASIMLGVDAYYSLYALISSAIFSMVLSITNRESIRYFVKYYSLLGISILISNAYFIYSTASLAFSPSVADKVGRVINLSENLIRVEAYFLPSPDSLLGSLLKYFNIYNVTGGSLVPYTVFLIFIFGSVWYWNGFSRFIKTLLLGGSINIVIFVLVGTDIPYFTLLQEWYFKYLGSFRSVGRMVIFVTLILSISCSIVLAAFFKQMRGNVKPIITMLAFCLLILIEGVNFNNTWLARTDFSKFAELHNIEPLMNAQAIAAFPREYPGFNMSQYSQLSQIVNHKPVYSTVDPRSEFKPQYHAPINLESANDIEELGKLGFDTILIYNRMYDYVYSGNRTREILNESPLLIHMGDYTNVWREKYASGVEFSQDISIYKIKQFKKLPTNIVELNGEPYKDVLKLSPYSYYVTTSGQNINAIRLNEPYNKGWLICSGKGGLLDILLEKCSNNTNSNVIHHGLRDSHYNNEWLFTNPLRVDSVTILFKSGVIKLFFDKLSNAYLLLLCFFIIYFFSSVRLTYIFPSQK